MKKLLLVLIMLALVLPAFAEDAKVLPKGVLRTYIAPSISFASEEFDADGEKSSTDSVTFVNIGAAFEYGASDWITAAIQWGPGYNVYSDIEGMDDASANGPFEAFVGAKVQVLGEMAPSKSDKFRVALAPGVMVPMAFGYDAEEEAGNAIAGEEYNILPAHNVFGVGGRFYADYIVNEEIFLNVYSQYKYFFPKAGEDDFSEQFTKQYTEALGGSYVLPDEIDYGYELTLEFEPHYATMIADGVELSMSLPITYVITPETEIDGTGQDDATKALDITGNVSAFFQKLPLPMEVKVGYTYPVWGEDTTAINSVVTQFKFYAKF